MNLCHLGWTKDVESQYLAQPIDGAIRGRIAREDRIAYLVWTEKGELIATVTGAFRFACASSADFPTVGDWVAVVPQSGENKGTIHRVLPRRSVFTRRKAGTQVDEQAVAANVDYLFLVCGLDGDLNPRRIERYLTLAWNSGASPVVILNKADVCPDLEVRMSDIGNVALSAPVHAISAVERSGLGQLSPYLRPGITVAMVGSSGVGKSTILNTLLGEDRQTTKSVRAGDDRGRHATTRRELFLLPTGGILIDTPGMRELQLWGDDSAGLSACFGDIEALALSCRYRDCRHHEEPGCAVRAAIDAGRLDPSRLSSYHKLEREAEYAEVQGDQHSRIIERKKWKRIQKAQRKLYQNRKRERGW